jgi:hypothetical protein
VSMFIASDRKWIRMWRGLCQERCEHSCDECCLTDSEQKTNVEWYVDYFRLIKMHGREVVHNEEFQNKCMRTHERVTAQSELEGEAKEKEGCLHPPITGAIPPSNFSQDPLHIGCRGGEKMCRVIHSLAEDMTDENGNNIGPQTLVLCNEWAEECNIDVDFVEDEACKLIGESVHRFIATYPIVLLHVGCDEHSEVYEMFTIITDMMRVCAASEPMADQELTSVIARWPMNCIRFLNLCKSTGFPQLVGSGLHMLLSHAFLTLTLRGSVSLFHSMQAHEHANKTDIKRGFHHTGMGGGKGIKQNGEASRTWQESMAHRWWHKVALSYLSMKTGKIMLRNSRPGTNTRDKKGNLKVKTENVKLIRTGSPQQLPLEGMEFPELELPPPADSSSGTDSDPELEEPDDTDCTPHQQMEACVDQDGSCNTSQASEDESDYTDDVCE